MQIEMRGGTDVTLPHQQAAFKACCLHTLRRPDQVPTKQAPLGMTLRQSLTKPERTVTRRWDAFAKGLTNQAALWRAVRVQAPLLGGRIPHGCSYAAAPRPLIQCM